MDSLDIRDTVIAALLPLGVDITDGAPTTGPDGRVHRTVIVGVTDGPIGSRRASGRGTSAGHTVNVLIVAPASDSCQVLTRRVQDVLDGAPLGRPHGILTDVSYDGPPQQEPQIIPARWSRALAFNTTTKRGGR